ncbi:hypothetical protein QN277_012959 [Acacia crassicarpa]|uniref:C2H2-type domain-containing protein n=1 Tax=Acacia crassicarpa TaxID=499986 RepID=A0AAE1N2Q4_9FABA|nr:hypothetical protein QN277_012959 [Acacia crassicarpa]
MQMLSGDPFSLSSSIGAFAPDPNPNPNPKLNPPPLPKKKRNLPGTPDPDAEVIALSPKSLMATNRFICEICNKGFQRDQNLQLHRRGHNLPWKLRQRSNKEVRKKVYICPEKTCVHHDPSRALGDLTGIKKHYSRKHGEKKWKCDKCSKKYAVQSDWKAHTKTCGTREYKCDCGTLFSRKDSFITHRAFCDALTEESARLTSVGTSDLNFKNEECVMNSNSQLSSAHGFGISQFGANGFRSEFDGMGMSMGGADQQIMRPNLSLWLNQLGNSGLYVSNSSSSESRSNQSKPASPMSATALLQKAAQLGSTRSSNPSIFSGSFGVMSSSSSQTTASLENNNADQIQNRNNNELNQVYHHQSMKQSENFSSSSSGVGGTLGISNNNNFSSLTHSSSSGLDELVSQSHGRQSNNKQVQLKLYPDSNNGEHGYTRDFLGMSGPGGVGAGSPFLPQELAKFASIASSMGMSQFPSSTTQ